MRLDPALPSRAPLHAAILGWIVGMLYLARYRPAAYEALVQEDRLVEWWTVFLFLAAAVAFGHAAWRQRRLGDAAVAVFCVAAAGEEVSWGQRIIGFVPNATFLQHNAQQEANLHNLVEAFGQPKWTLIAVLVAYGMVVPALAHLPRVRLILERIGLRIPDGHIAVGFAIAVGLLLWYPVRLTGEWVEALCGALFLAASSVRLRGPAIWALLALAAAFAAERATALVATDPRRIACANHEVHALLADIQGDSTAAAMAGPGRTHRRLYSLWRDGDLAASAAQRFRRAACAGLADTDVVERRRYGVDPWGTAYWVRAWGDSAGRHVLVYSFGPNRRRDDLAGSGTIGDDIEAHVTAPK